MAYFEDGGIKDLQTGTQVWVSEFNSLRTSEITRLVGTPFFGNTKDTNFWSEAVVGTGSVVQAGGVVTLATGSTANSTAQYQSVRIARWVPGDENSFRTMLKVGDTGTANNIRNWGMFDANNGFFFQLNGTTLNVVSRAGGADTAVAKASWNTSNAFVLDTNLHCWEITATQSAIHFYVDHILVHTINNVGAASFPSQSLNLPVTIQNNNSGGSTSNVSIVSGVAFISRTGKIETDCKFLNISASASTTTLKYSAGRIHRVIVGTSGATSVTLYDNVAGSGTVIAVITLTAAPVVLDIQAPFFTGLTAVVAGSSPNFTIVYE